MAEVSTAGRTPPVQQGEEHRSDDEGDRQNIEAPRRLGEDGPAGVVVGQLRGDDGEHQRQHGEKLPPLAFAELRDHIIILGLTRSHCPSFTAPGATAKDPGDESAMAAPQRPDDS